MDQEEVERRLDRVTRRITPIVPKVQKVEPDQPWSLKGWKADAVRRLLFCEYLVKSGRIGS